MVKCIMLFSIHKIENDCRSKTDTERQNLGHIVEKRIKNFDGLIGSDVFPKMSCALSAVANLRF